MSSSPHKWHRKRPADSGDIGQDEGGQTPDQPEDFKIKTLDEILQEKRRRIEKDDEPEERKGSSEENSSGASPVTSAKRDSRTSSKQGSPFQGPSVNEIIYQLSPEQLSLSPSEYILQKYARSSTCGCSLNQE